MKDGSGNNVLSRGGICAAVPKEKNGRKIRHEHDLNAEPKTEHENKKHGQGCGCHRVGVDMNGKSPSELR